MELKSQQQFLSLEQELEKWRQSRFEEPISKRFQLLTEETWARENLAVEEIWGASVHDPSWANGTAPAILRQKNHILAVRWWLEQAGQKQALTVADLLELHRLLWTGLTDSAGFFRKESILACGETPDEIEAGWIPSLVANALDWFATEGFRQIHCVEQTALVLLRLLDLRPFSVGTDTTIRIFASHFLLQAGYPPFLLSSAQVPQYMAALNAAVQFDTQGIVDFIASSVGNSLAFCLGESSHLNPFPIIRS